MQHLFTTRTSLVAKAATGLIALATLVAFQPQRAAAQYTFKSGGVNWGATGRWTGGPTNTIPNAVDATATFNLPLSSDANPASASFTMNLVNSIPTPPGTITLGAMIINNTAGNLYDTTFGNSANPGFVFQVSSGSAAYTESAGTSDGSTTISVPITLMSNLVVTQNHVDSNNLNAGTTFSNKINGAAGIKFIKEGNANLNLSYSGALGVGEGFFGTYEFNQGAVRFISNVHLQNAAGMTVKSGAQVQFGLAASATLGLASGALSLEGAGVVGGPSNNEGALLFQTASGVTSTFSSPIVLGAPVTGDNIIRVQTNGGGSGAIADLSGAISGVASDLGFLKSGSGDLYLSGSDSNTYQGATGLTTGGLYLNKSNNAIAVPGNLNIGGSGLVVVQRNQQIADTSLLRFTSATQYGGVLRLGGLNRQETVGGILSTNSQSGTIESNYNGTDPNGSISTLTVAGVHASQFDGLVRDTGFANPPFVGKLAIAKTGAEPLTFTNNNTYTGGTTISGGAFVADNSRAFVSDGSATGTGAVLVNGGTLAGRGFVTGATTVASTGRVAPGLISGTTTGTLTLADTTFNSGSFLDIEIGSLSDYDHLVVDNAGVGTAALAGTLNVTLLNGFMPALNDTFQILTAATARTGTFDATSLPALTGGNAWQVNYEPNYVELKIITAPAGVTGDYNNDGKVDAADYVIWRKADGTNNALPNDNGLGVPIGSSHYALWRANFGNPPGSGSSLEGANVPEPTLVLLALQAMVGGLASVRRR